MIASSRFGQSLKDYRKRYQLTQEQLAEDLSVDVRTIRRWEKGALTNVIEIRRVADGLGIDVEEFGMKAIEELRTPEEIDVLTGKVWTLFKGARTYEARTIIEKLAWNLSRTPTSDEPKFLRSLAGVYHAAGVVTSVNTKSNESYKSIPHYQKLAEIARVLDDHTFLNIALTYHGDMLRRNGNHQQAIAYLEAARDTTPLADTAAKGNAVQLLGRAYLRSGDVYEFERAMAQAEEIAATVDPVESSTHGQYNLGAVYEEYGKSYGALGQTQKALAYLDRAEAVLPKTKPWEVLIQTSRAVSLVRGGEFRTGVDIAVKIAPECRTYGKIRCLERIYGMFHYLEQVSQDIGHAKSSLREVLDGPIGPWDTLGK